MTLISNRSEMGNQQAVKEHHYLLSVPESVTLYGSGPEHDAAVQQEIDRYRAYGVEPVAVLPSAHYSNGAVIRSTQVVWKHGPIELPRDYVRELQWAIDHEAQLREELKGVRRRLKRARKVAQEST